MLLEWTPTLSTPPDVVSVMPASQRFMQFRYPLPYGAILQDGGVQFAVYSKSATAMRVLLYRRVTDTDPYRVIEFNPATDRWGDIWSMYVPDLEAGQLYHFQADGPYNPERGHRFNPQARLIDPYARALAGSFQTSDDGVIRPPKCVVIDDTFDWKGDRHLKRPLAESVIYEMHVRGLTKRSNSGVEHPGTYLGVIEKIPYLKSLGVTAVELMPVHEFPTRDPAGNRHVRGNYWGYDSLAFFSPHRGYMSGKEPGDQVRQFKEMVRALHAEGIEVILDVVFNHTAEGNHMGPTLSFKGLENRVYYMLNGDGTYKNYSGCGNTVNGNHPIVREMIFHCLRHWVYNYHIDGFRFDLASILSRNRHGELVPNPPMVEIIAEDPMLADTKIIAEAWDAAGAFQVGSFANMRWAEWNGHYRDDVRRFWRGDPGMIGPVATRISGSSDLYQPSGRHPYHSINFVTSHDGYPLADLCSYERKHNQENGEDNRDGDNNNYSSNYGVEGPTRRKHVVELRRRQCKNMMATLLLSEGTPMIVAGDEILRTQRGNNNAYCQDNEISWFNWSFVEKNAEMLRFTQALIAFRKEQPNVRRPMFLTGSAPAEGELPDVSWYGPGGGAVDWNAPSRSLTCVLGTAGLDDPAARNIMIMLHAGGDTQEFVVPAALRKMPWKLFIDTAAAAPGDIYPAADGPALPTGGKVKLIHHTLRCYVA
ncbi:MAG: glycogen debranching enzyme GlgX [Planctomycetaceae bacterium]|nr:glycogen debranching enzyme GlgX [Planctomycetaceae bacterium]